MLAKTALARGCWLQRHLCRTMGDASSTHEFDVDTALRPNSGDASFCRLRRPLSAAWSVSGAPNGGLLAAIGISAMRFHPEQHLAERRLSQEQRPPHASVLRTLSAEYESGVGVAFN